MKISILTTELIANGGAARQVLMLAQRLEALGHRATVYAMEYCSENCYPEVARNLDIRAVERVSVQEVRRRSRERHHNILRGVNRHLVASRALARIVHEPCDILNPHVRAATHSAVLSKRQTRTPVVWMCEDARNWEQHGYRPYYTAPVQFVFDRVMGLLEKPVVREIDRVVTLDHRVKAIIERYYQRPAEVVRSGVDSISFCKREKARDGIRVRHGIARNDFLLLWLGIVEPHRRLEDVIEALRLLHLRGAGQVKCLIAGSGTIAPEYVQNLHRIAADYRLAGSVRFHLVSIPEREIADYYSAADALVYMAENQCWGLGVFEAIACNLPVIVSRSCGAHEVLLHGETAMLVDPRRPESLARAVTDLIANPSLAEKLSKNARMHVLSRFTWEAYARDMLRIFNRVLSDAAQTVTPLRREAFA